MAMQVFNISLYRVDTSSFLCTSLFLIDKKSFSVNMKFSKLTALESTANRHLLDLWINILYGHLFVAIQTVSSQLNIQHGLANETGLQQKECSWRNVVHDSGSTGEAFKSIVMNNNSGHFLKSLLENAEGMFWRFAAPHHFKPITNTMGAEDSENAVWERWVTVGGLPTRVAVMDLEGFVSSIVSMS